ncbi:hypothetical protein [Nocardia sp. NPDC059239]|uniref:hypothetical protein n=1 Tax=unclassified Nocardia TaxID=2637762 RepID=UPI0036B1B448
MSADVAGPTMPGEAPPDMDPATRRSQSQARDLAGHYGWPDITTTTNREDTEPMNDTTHPDHTAEPNETESETEQQMRADFMHAWDSLSRDPEEYDPADAVDYAEYSGPWVSNEHWRDEWDYLWDATHRWRENPAAAVTALRASLDDKLTPSQRRSELQACYIAEHGIECNESGLLTSHYVTRVQDRAESAAGAPSPLADYQAGNALAAHLANSERDGFER